MMKTYRIKIIREDGPRRQFEKQGRLEIAQDSARIVLKTKDREGFLIDPKSVSQVFRTAASVIYRPSPLRFRIFLALALLLSLSVLGFGIGVWLAPILIIGGVLLSFDTYVRVVIVLEQQKILVLMPTKAFYYLLNNKLLNTV